MGMEIKEDPKHGKKPNQKLKPYLVLQHLMRKTDENNVLSAEEIVFHLEQKGIDAERRSIYSDIREINKAVLLAENDEMTVKEADNILNEDEEGLDKTIVYNASKKGFFVRQRHYDFDDIRLLNECVYSAKFLSEGQTKRLSNVVCEFVSEAQAKEIQHNAILIGRIKTINKSVINSISIINKAMLNKKPHVPEKISFKYLKFTINDLNHQAERKQGENYKVSPYALLLNDGNYYMLAYDDRYQKIRTYRVDRMRDVKLTGEPREGSEDFAAIDLKTYPQRVFSMFGGDQERVTIRFTNHLLDSVIDRFGTNDAFYIKVDDHHFNLIAKVEISNQFFGWVCGFGREAKIVSPPTVEDQFKKYVDKIRSIY